MIIAHRLLFAMLIANTSIQKIVWQKEWQIICLKMGVTFNRRWISVAEQLPNTDGRFEVTIKGSKGKRYIAVCNYNKNANFDKWGNVNVIAW